MIQSADLQSADQWKADRWTRLLGLIEEIAVHNGFQQMHWPKNKGGVEPKDFTQFQEECPFTTKDQLARDRAENPPYGTNLTYPIDQYTRYNQTSGTLGEPMAWLDTPGDWQWMLGNWNVVLKNAGVRKGAKCFFAFSFGPFLGFWTAYEAAMQNGCLCIPGGGQSSEQRLKIILEQGVEYLFCTPTYALHLLQVTKDLRIDLAHNQLRTIIVAGETGGSDKGIKDKISMQWNGVQVYDHYGMTEVGPVAYEIPDQSVGLRIIQESYFAEVIDPVSTQTVPNGELGELVLTTLGRTGCPVLRYRSGDLVKAVDGFDEKGIPTFDLIGGILGRIDDMIIVRGVNLYPSSVDAVIRKFDEVKEYRVYKEKAGPMLEITIEVESSLEVANLIEVALKEVFSLRISVKPVPNGTFPQFEMKAKRWEDKLL